MANIPFLKNLLPKNGSTMEESESSNFASGYFSFNEVLKSSCAETKEEFTIFPNPVSDFTTVSIISKEKAQLVLNLYDSKGALIRVYKKQILAGTNQLQVSVSGLAKGNYSLNAVWNNSSKTIWLVK